MYRVRTGTTLLYLAPMIIGVGLISFYPILYNIFISVTNQNLYHFRHYSFVGVNNYQSLLKTFDADFFIVLGRTFLFVGICIPLFLAVGMLAALALNHPAVRQAFWRIILPLSIPALAVTALLMFLTAWNEWVMASVLLLDENTYTVPVGLWGLQNDYRVPWGYFAAASLIVSIPVMGLFLGLQRYFRAGLTVGGVKG